MKSVQGGEGMDQRDDKTREGYNRSTDVQLEGTNLWREEHVRRGQLQIDPIHEKNLELTGAVVVPGRHP